MNQDIYLDVEITVEKVADKNTLVSMLKQAREYMEDDYAYFMGKAFDNYILAIENNNTFAMQDELIIKLKDNTYGPELDIVCVRGGTWEEYFDNNAEFMVNSGNLFYKGMELAELRECLKKAGFNIKWQKTNSRFQSQEDIYKYFENNYYWRNLNG